MHDTLAGELAELAMPAPRAQLLIHGTAFYVHYSHPDRVADMEVDAIADEFVSDVLS